LTRSAFRRQVADRDRRPVAGSGEAVPQAPVLERVRRRAAAGVDVVQDLDRGGQAGGGRHRTMLEPGRCAQHHSDPKGRAEGVEKWSALFG